MEANKIKGEAKSIVLANGIELTYCECGQEHKNVMLCGAFYYHTLMPVVEKLANRYHVYGIVMRFEGMASEKNADGTIHWGKQWGKDIYDFAKTMGITKFHYFGKCHGTIPGWYLIKEHPEMLLSFSSFFLAPHVRPQNSNHWFELLSSGDAREMMRVAMRKPECLQAKMAELAVIGENAINPIIPKYAASPETLWNNKEACVHTLATLSVPVAYLFGSEDPLFDDYFDSNLFAIRHTKGAHTVILEGERHLIELDNPKRVVKEVFSFIDGI